MLGRGVQFPCRIVHPAALHSSEQLLTPRAPPEQRGDTKCRITSCKAAIPSDLLGISQGIYPSSTSLQVSGEELVAHHHFCVVPGTDKPSQGIFHIPWSREFLGSGPSCSLSAPRFFIPFFHPESSLCVSVDVKCPDAAARVPRAHRGSPAVPDVAVTPSHRPKGGWIWEELNPNMSYTWQE